MDGILGSAGTTAALPLGRNRDALFLRDATRRRGTTRRAVRIAGTGVHSGRAVRVAIEPAPSGSGIRFLRDDLSPSVAIPARWDLVADTRLCTVLAAPGRPDIRVATVEHLMAALSACRIDDALVRIDGEELPILDGSSAPWMALLSDAGCVRDAAEAPRIEVLRPVCVTAGGGSVRLLPGRGFSLEVSIEFDAAAIGRQRLRIERMDRERFEDELADCRTFALAHEIEGLRAAGLARGGSLDNAVVVDGGRVLNPSGLRRPDEFVRHKALDAVGDLALGGRIEGRYVGVRPGHALNNRLLAALFADRANWRVGAGAPAPRHAA